MKNPVVTKERMFYEAMEEVLPDLKLIIDSGDGVDKILPLESFSTIEMTTSGSSASDSGMEE